MLSGRQVESAKVFGYVCSKENAAGIVTRSCRSSVERVFSSPDLVQILMAKGAANSSSSPVLAVVGEAGSGKTALLRSVCDKSRSFLPLRCVPLFDEEEVESCLRGLLQLLVGSREVPAAGAAHSLLNSMASAAIGPAAVQQQLER